MWIPLIVINYILFNRHIIRPLFLDLMIKVASDATLALLLLVQMTNLLLVLVRVLDEYVFDFGHCLEFNIGILLLKLNQIGFDRSVDFSLLDILMVELTLIALLTTHLQIVKALLCFIVLYILDNHGINYSVCRNFLLFLLLLLSSSSFTLPIFLSMSFHPIFLSLCKLAIWTGRILIIINFLKLFNL